MVCFGTLVLSHSCGFLQACRLLHLCAIAGGDLASLKTVTMSVFFENRSVVCAQLGLSFFWLPSTTTVPL